MPRYILLHETASTNTYLARMAAILPSGTVIYTHNQSAGRGQRGNSWEAEPGKNLTFSQLIKDAAVAPAEQFYISEGASLAVVEFLSRYIGDVSIKWPNDIYYRDKKICGMLIEHSLQGNAIKTTIIGIGLNINQAEFRSNAPNPISLLQITGQELDLEKALRDLCELVEKHTDFRGYTPERFAKMHGRYLASLYRNDGEAHEFALPDGTRISATITDVRPDGTLVLTLADGTVAHFAFKEVAFII